MDETRITAVVRNPAEPDRLWEGVFIVDTGAMDSSVPRRRLEAIGLPAAGLRVYVMGDGREVRMPVTAGIIQGNRILKSTAMEVPKSIGARHQTSFKPCQNRLFQTGQG
jgi:predicted aspartyl protease